MGQSFGLKARFPLSLALMKKIIVLLAVAACLLAVPALAVKTKAKPSAPAHKAVEGSLFFKEVSKVRTSASSRKWSI